jgi:hypothetical protein
MDNMKNEAGQQVLLDYRNLVSKKKEETQSLSCCEKANDRSKYCLITYAGGNIA